MTAVSRLLTARRGVITAGELDHYVIFDVMRLSSRLLPVILIYALMGCGKSTSDQSATTPETESDTLSVEAPGVVFWQPERSTADTTQSAVEVHADFRHATEGLASRLQSAGLRAHESKKPFVLAGADSEVIFQASDLEPCCATIFVRKDSTRILEGALTGVDLLREEDTFFDMSLMSGSGTH